MARTRPRPKRENNEPPLVLGGSLTRGSEGRLQTLQTHGMFPTPAAVQDLWARVQRQRYPKTWDGQPLGDYGYIVEWSEPRVLVCSHPRCGRSLGRYVAYHAGDEYGVVEHTTRTYTTGPDAGETPGTRQMRPQPRFQLTGMGHHSAKQTRATFWCESCKRHRVRNLARLGQKLFENESSTPFMV